MAEGIVERIIKKLYREWQVDSYLTEIEYTEFVKDSYPLIVERAKAGETIFYGELPCFNVLRDRFADGVRKVIGFIVGACSEYETANDRPPISAIVITKDTGEPGEGFYGLSLIPPNLSMDMWELQHRTPTEAVANEREKFWLEQLKKVFNHWRGK
jgi:hypothetical protein